MINEIDVKEYFKKAIKHLRKKRNWTQKDLAKKLNISHITIQNYENGTLPRCDKLIDICNILETSPNELLGISSEYLDTSMLSKRIKEERLRKLIELYNSFPDKKKDSLLKIAYELKKL